MKKIWKLEINVLSLYQEIRNNMTTQDRLNKITALVEERKMEKQEILDHIGSHCKLCQQNQGYASDSEHSIQE